MKKILLGQILVIILILYQYLYPFKDLLPSFIQIVFIMCLLCIIKKNISKNLILLLLLNIFILLKIIISQNYSLEYFSPINLIFVNYFMLFSSYCIYRYLKKIELKKRNTIKKIIQYIIDSLIITCFFSIYYITYVDPQAIRNTQRHFLWGVGDFELVYTLSFVVLALGSEIMQTKRVVSKGIKYKFYLLFLLSSYVILKSNLVTSVVIYFIALFLLGISLFNISKKKIIMLITTIVIFAYLLKKNLSDIFIELASSNLFYWSTQKKLMAISNIFQGNFEHLDTLNSRYNLMMQSFTTFKNHILIGVSYENIKSGIIGGHAGWADLLAEFGIVGSVFILYILYNLFKEQIEFSEHLNEKKCICNSWLLFIILGFFNPNFMGGVLYTLFIIPPFISVLEEKK